MLQKFMYIQVYFHQNLQKYFCVVHKIETKRR